VIMRTSASLISIAATGAIGFFLAATMVLGPGSTYAQSENKSLSAIEVPPAANNGGGHAPGATGNSTSNGSCSCPNQPSNEPLPRDKLWPKPSLAELKATLDDTDAIAALEALQLALTEVGDGATYIWHRKHGRLSGAIQPTASFKDASGQICRHIVVAMTSGSYSRKAEGIACRTKSGVWTLEG
jgi:hypothetical protein